MMKIAWTPDYTITETLIEQLILQNDSKKILALEECILQKKRHRLYAIDQSIINIVKRKSPETVKQLIELVRLKYSLSEREIMEHIVRLQSQRKLILKEHHTPLPSTAKGYLFSTRAIWYWVILALSLTTTTMVFTIPEGTFPIIYIRYILGSVFVLLLPGYSFIKALFPRKELDNVELVALSLGMSLALVPITGLLLNYTPWGIGATPIIFSLFALTVAFATAAIIREYQTRLKEMVRNHSSDLA